MGQYLGLEYGQKAFEIEDESETQPVLLIADRRKPKIHYFKAS